MALVSRRDGRNYGYGRQLSYAGPPALKDMFGGGHYGTVKAHCDRWLAFVKWCRSEQWPDINDARQIDRKVLADMRRICATWLGAATSLSALHKIGCLALGGPWRRFAVISA